MVEIDNGRGAKTTTDVEREQVFIKSTSDICSSN